MFVSVVVCTHSLDNYQNLVQAIDSLLAQSYREIEIIIIVDGNRDLFKDVVAVYGARDDIKIIANEQSLGAFGAGNVGVKASVGDIIAFLDDDAVADVKWIENLVQMYKERDAVSVGGNVLPIWLSKQPNYFPEELYWLVGVTHDDFGGGIVSEVRNTYGVNMSFRRKVFEEIGSLNAELGFSKGGTSYMQGAEPEFALRMKEHFGRGVIYNPDAIVYHKIPISKTGFKKLIRRAFYQGYSKALMKRFGRLPDTLATEKSYLRDLLFKYIPRRVKGIFSRGCSGEIKKLVLLVSVIFSVGLGFLYGYVKGKS
jgi:glycosyltransferase involved in cell wall biosynthesis